MTGRLIISLDFELMWGVRDHRSVDDYGDAVLGVRRAIPQMLALFKEFDIHATWATVGLLFARNKAEMMRFVPDVLPAYRNACLSPYPALSRIGEDEASDPYHFGRSLLDQIANTKGQEIATHTFGHVYALEPGMTPEAWRADLVAALAIAKETGLRMQSIVFPRNQTSATHTAICKELGLNVVRGNPDGSVYRARSGAELTLPVRAMRFLDGAIPLLGNRTISGPRYKNGVVDVPASRFLRPWTARLPLYSSLHQRRIQHEMTRAARLGHGYHLWWHPHNMGRNTAQNLSQLRQLLECFAALRTRYDFQSVTMAEYGGMA